MESLCSNVTIDVCAPATLIYRPQRLVSGSLQLFAQCQDFNPCALSFTHNRSHSTQKLNLKRINRIATMRDGGVSANGMRIWRRTGGLHRRRFESKYLRSDNRLCCLSHQLLCTRLSRFFTWFVRKQVSRCFFRVKTAMPAMPSCRLLV